MGGLFSMFRSDRGDKMSPHLAFATALIYMMGADGEMDNEEIGALLAVLGGEEKNGVIGVGANNRILLEKAQQYARRNSVDAFIAEATPLLTDAQRICVLINLIDMSFADGQPEPEEQELFMKIQRGFGISDERFRPFFEVIMIKNDRTVFVNQSHPANTPGHTVKLSV
ncbi:MAG: TerB family tellurite resistance protein [Oscillochloris sp.]|nr:TerB family tellurite resistance protein [Oscillochloris sp.]